MIKYGKGLEKEIVTGIKNGEIEEPLTSMEQNLHLINGEKIL